MNRGHRGLRWGSWGTLLHCLSVFAGQGLPERGSVALNHSATAEQLLRQYAERYQVPGLSLAIVQAPYISRIDGFGWADEDKKRLVGSRTLFALGHMTEAYTAVAVLQLKEQGKLSLEDTLDKHLKDLPKAWQNIQLGALLNHSSGIPCYRSQKSFDSSKAYTRSEAMGLVDKLPLEFPTGTQAVPSSTGYALLGAVIEACSGKSYEAFVEEGQFKPLGLKATTFSGKLAQLSQEMGSASESIDYQGFRSKADLINPTEWATGYSLQRRALKEVKPVKGPSLGDWGIWASAEDISTWDVGLAGSILVRDKDDRSFLYSPAKLANGTTVPSHGRWEFPGHPGLMWIRSGSADGCSCILMRYTAHPESLCVTLCTNRGDLEDLAILGVEVAGSFDGTLLGPDLPAPYRVNPSPWSVKETLDRVASIAQKGGVKMFARIDQADEAKKAGQSLRPTEVLLLGNPAQGTALMEGSSAVTMDLPLRVGAWKDDAGQTWVGFTDLLCLAKDYHLKEDDPIREMDHGLLKVVTKATSGYSLPAPSGSPTQ